MWRPTASWEMIRRRATWLAEIRRFFAERGVLEVETPVLSSSAATDPNLLSFVTRYEGPAFPEGRTLYLHTSPEFAMKRLLAAGSGSIYQICKVFRDGEAGRLHNPEFTLLEWYRPGSDHHALMAEVDELLQRLLGSRPAQYMSYQEAFVLHVGLDPVAASAEELRIRAESHGVAPPAGLQRDGWLDLLLSHVLAPQLGLEGPLFLFDYPASQAALARIRPPFAERFELFLQGVELANGFHELADADEQRRRFNADLAARGASGLPGVPPDEHLVAALDAGLPDCSGVALGVDRLLMVACDLPSIADVLTFPVTHA
jgi:elongation factor P--(R)-beta-lysine ligase